MSDLDDGVSTATGVSTEALLSSSLGSGRQAPNEYEAKQMIKPWGLQVPEGVLVSRDDIAASAYAHLSEPLVIKFMGPDVLHKTEFGAVRVGVSRQDVPAEVCSMLADPRLQDLSCDGILIEEMTCDAQELVIGGFHDVSFGPVVMLGSGGILLEIMEDVTFRICPIDASEARSMLDELRGVSLLTGFRGRPPVDLDAVVAALLAIGGADGLLMSMRSLSVELDINPLLVTTDAAVAADVRIVPTELNPVRESVAAR